MTKTDLNKLFDEKIAELGVSALARALGYSAGAISQIKNGKYGGEVDQVLLRLEEVYGNTIMDCPVFGCEISLGRCADERRKLPRYTNPVAGLLSATCPTCKSRR